MEPGSVQRAVLHVDMDAFFASVEQLDHPPLRGRPVLVGGDGPRGVVAAASYEARESGCRSAQPMAIARRLCPQAVIVAPRGGRYREVSGRVLDILESFTPLVEPLSIDEAFLDVSGSEALFGAPREIAAAIKARIRDELALTASVGVAPNKFLAKLASEMDKPDGLTVIEPGRVRAAIDGLPVGRMWGVGPATGKKLRDLGIGTFGDLGRYPAAVLESVLGASGPRIAELARGVDDRDVVPDGRARSISQERTFACDLEDADAVRDVLLGHVEHVGLRLRRHRLRAGTATVKIRFGDFQTVTRSSTFPEATQRTDLLWRAGRALFDRWASASLAPVRLIGFGAAQLRRDGEQLNLFTAPDDERHKALDRVTDSIRERFGRQAIRRGH